MGEDVQVVAFPPRSGVVASLRGGFGAGGVVGGGVVFRGPRSVGSGTGITGEVVDPGAGFRGLVSAKDLLKVIASDHKERADMLESYMFPQH